MTDPTAKYAKDENGVLVHPKKFEFKGYLNYLRPDSVYRKHGYLPVVGEPENRVGYSATPATWHVVHQEETIALPHQDGLPDGRTATRDTSYIQIDSWEYAEIPAPEQQPDITAQIQKVTELIFTLANKYNARPEIMAMQDMNIESLDALINAKGVTDDDKLKIAYTVTMVVADLMGKLKTTWYDIWNDQVKPALTQAIAAAAEQGQGA